MMRPEDRDTLADRLVVWQGPPPTDLARTTSFLLDMCHKADADTVVVDGLKDVALKLTDDEVGSRLNQAFQRCVADGVEVVANHHQRKSQNGTTTKPKTLANLYGSTWIGAGAGAGTVVLAWADAAGSPTIEVSTLKPAQDNVGPISVLHDLKSGALEVVDALRLEDVLRAADMPRSITELAATLGIPELDTPRREALRRQLRDLERTHGLDVLEAPSPTGGRPEKRWTWRAG